MKNTVPAYISFFFRSIGIHFCKEFLKPWKEFRKWILVFASGAKNTSEEAPFLLVRFLLSPTTPSIRGRGRHNKENEQKKLFTNCSRLPAR